MNMVVSLSFINPDSAIPKTNVTPARFVTEPLKHRGQNLVHCNFLR